MILKKIISISFKIINKIFAVTINVLAGLYNYLIIYCSDIVHGKNIVINGFAKFDIKNGSVVKIGDDFRLNSGNRFNSIGRNQRSLFVVLKNAKLLIGNNVGMSSVAIICHLKITIGNNVKIGGNVLFYDTDFHSLNYNERISIPELKDNIKVKPIDIKDNVFIGGHSIILKGTIIGKNSIIGAGSIVSGIIPSNEIWAGNPARFIKKIDVK